MIFSLNDEQKNENIMVFIYLNLWENVVQELVDFVVGADQQSKAVLLLPGEWFLKYKQH